MKLTTRGVLSYTVEAVTDHQTVDESQLQDSFIEKKRKCETVQSPLVSSNDIKTLLIIIFYDNKDQSKT